METLSIATGSSLPRRRREIQKTGDPTKMPAGSECVVGGDRAEVEDAAARLDAARPHVVRERREADDTQDGAEDDVGARAVPPVEEPLDDELVDGRAQRDAGDAPLCGEVALARQPTPGAELGDQVTQTAAEQIAGACLRR